MPGRRTIASGAPWERVEVSGLIHPDVLIEIEADAAVTGKGE